jgi:ribosomal protein S27E
MLRTATRRRTMGFDRGCPGQDRSNWTPDDIFEVKCAGCGQLVEFYKDDARRYCPSCGACVLNPKQDVGCAAWCAAAEKCSVGRQWIEEDPLKDVKAINE